MKVNCRKYFLIKTIKKRSNRCEELLMTEKDSQGVVYTKENDYYIVGTNELIDNNAESNLSSLIIPSKFNKISVKVIGKFAFRNTATLKSIFIPNTIEELRYDCFSWSVALEHVHFAENSRLRKLETGVFYGTNIKEISMPPTIKYYGYNCFGRTNIESLFICGKPSSISEYIFGTNFNINFKSFPVNLFVSDDFPFNKFGECDKLNRTNACQQNIKTRKVSKSTHSFYFLL